MGLSASMWSGVSGLLAQGEKMGVVGNNLANVSTIGFKSSTMHFEDMISQDISTSAGVSQVGRGVRVGTVYSDFSQGSFETTSESTDVAIGGKGFFVVRSPNNQTNYYTRAGNFRFDENGYLTDSHGNIVQGWDASTGLNNNVQISGSPTDLRLNNYQSAPEASSNVNMILNLDSAETSHTDNATDPAAALYSAWDANSTPPLGSTNYAYQSTLKVYDTNGGAHDLTVYFDKVDTTAQMTGANGSQVWEYIVTVPPAEDQRDVDIPLLNQAAPAASKKGLLMTGTLTFDSNGQLTGMNGYTLQNPAADPNDPTQWQLADLNSDGHPMVAANFLGVPGASVSSSATASNIAMNFGMRSTNPIPPNWQGTDSDGDGAMTLADVGTAFGNLANIAIGERSVDAQATTAHNDGNATLFQNQDGHTSGLLKSIEVDTDGVVIGRYTNGEVSPLFKLTLASFTSEWGLRREGMNLFSETNASGQAMTGQANTGTLGSINSYSLEQSNVDMSKEMVEMILTQRGFQANSKTITTADTLLGEIIQLKR